MFKSFYRFSTVISLILSTNILFFSAFPTLVLATPGALDRSFDGDGTTNLATVSEGIEDIAAQPDGKIIVVGTNGGGNAGDLANFEFIRYNNDGSLDTGFGNNGSVSVDFAGLRDVPFSVVVDSSGKIIAGGFSRKLGYALVRLNSDGSLDTSFDGDGRVIVTTSGTIRSLVVDGNGKIVAAGGFDNVNIRVVRFNNDGSLDTSFSGDGIAEVGFNSAIDVRLQSSGKIVVAGTKDSDFAVARLNTDGSLDTLFGTNGIVLTDINNAHNPAEAMEISSSDKIIVGGTAQLGQSQDFALVQYTADGALDTTFDSDGIATTNFGGSDDNNFGDVALNGGGKIIVAGNAFITGRYRTVSTRYNSNGSIDTSYGINSNGKAIIEVSGFDISPRAIAIQADGQVVIGGVFDDGTATVFGINRLNGGTLENDRQTTVDGGSLSMDWEGDGGANVNDPVETTVTTPVGGVVSISETTATTPTVDEISFLEQKVIISAPIQTAVSPLVIKFRIDGSIIPQGQNKNNIAVYKNGVLVGACTGPAGQASPDPCISARDVAPGGDVDITLLASSD